MFDQLEVKRFYPYRGAMAAGKRFQLPQHLVEDLRRRLEEEASEALGQMCHDNKTTFEVSDGSNQTWYISFYDWSCYIGPEVEVQENEGLPIVPPAKV